MARVKTSYPGVYYRNSRRIGGAGVEKVYYITFKKDGRMVEEKAGRQFADDMTPARAARIRAERIEGRRQSRKEIRARKTAETGGREWTIGALWREYRQSRKANSGLVNDDSRWKVYLKKDYENRLPAELEPLEMDRLKTRLLKIRAAETVAHVLGLLSQIVNYGVKMGLIKPLGFRIVKPQVNSQVTECLTGENLQNLLQAIEADHDEPIKAMMRLALFTGMRKGELLNLKWEDVDFDRGFIWIRDPKGGRDASIPMNAEARTVLEGLAGSKRGGLLFPPRAGASRKDVQRGVNRIKKAAELPEDFRPLHGLRHTYASMLASSGQVDMFTLQKLLTHKDFRMTQRYAHLHDDALKRGAGVMDSLIEAAKKKPEPDDSDSENR